MVMEPPLRTTVRTELVWENNTRQVGLAFTSYLRQCHFEFQDIFHHGDIPIFLTPAIFPNILIQ